MAYKPELRMEDSQAVSMVCLYTYECLACSPCSKLILEKAVGIRAIFVWFTAANCVGESTIRHFRYCYTNVTPTMHVTICSHLGHVP